MRDNRRNGWRKMATFERKPDSDFKGWPYPKPLQANADRCCLPSSKARRALACLIDDGNRIGWAAMVQAE